jgi:hypothetical protein
MTLGQVVGIRSDDCNGADLGGAVALLDYANEDGERSFELATTPIPEKIEGGPLNHGYVRSCDQREAAEMLPRQLGTNVSYSM